MRDGGGTFRALAARHALWPRRGAGGVEHHRPSVSTDPWLRVVRSVLEHVLEGNLVIQCCAERNATAGFGSDHSRTACADTSSNTTVLASEFST